MKTRIKKRSIFRFRMKLKTGKSDISSKKEEIITKPVSSLNNHLDLTELEIDSRKIHYGYFNEY